MRITFVVLLCSIATALASITGERFLDTLMDEIMDQNLIESDARQGQAIVPQKSFKDYLARFMQLEVPCPAPGCHLPWDRFICGNDDRQIITNPNVNPNQWICRLVMTLTDGSVTSVLEAHSK